MISLKHVHKLKQHLYSKLHTPAAIEHAKKDWVPNRHAVLHGLVDYDNQCSSFNAIVIFDFVLMVVSGLRSPNNPQFAFSFDMLQEKFLSLETRTANKYIGKS